MPDSSFGSLHISWKILEIFEWLYLVQYWPIGKHQTSWKSHSTRTPTPYTLLLGKKPENYVLVSRRFRDFFLKFYIDLSLFCYLFLNRLRLLILKSTIMKSVGESSDGKKREPGRESPFSIFPSHHSPLAYCVGSHHPSLELFSRLQWNSVPPA